MEQRIQFYLLFVAVFGVGVLWTLGYRVTAGVLTAIPVLMYFAGDRLSRGLDRVCVAVTKSWRAIARRPGRRYCPACACALQTPKTSRPVAGDECPACDGAWCDSREFLHWLTAYGTAEESWRAIPRDELSPPMLCPKCAVPLQTGSLDRLQPYFSRCVACDGHWIDRMAWAWFALTPPKGTRSARPARATPEPAPNPAPSEPPVPRFAFGKTSAP